MSESQPSSKQQLNVRIREGNRSDIPTLARLLCDAFQDDELANYTLPGRDQYPTQHYQHYLRILRQVFVTPAMKFVLAVSTSVPQADKQTLQSKAPSSDKESINKVHATGSNNATETILGFACYGAEPPSSLHDLWKQQGTDFSSKIDQFLLTVEDLYVKYITNRIADHTLIDRIEHEKAGDFTPPGAAAAGQIDHAVTATLTGDRNKFPEIGPLRLQMLATRPEWQGRGVGRRLLRWGTRNARAEGMPVIVAGSSKGKGFYEKDGFVVFREDVVGDLKMPCLIWEPDQFKGRWVAWDNVGKRWKLKSKGDS